MYDLFSGQKVDIVLKKSLLIYVELLTLLGTLITFKSLILHMNLFHANLPWKYHKTNYWFSGVFRRNRKGKVGWNGLIVYFRLQLWAAVSQLPVDFYLLEVSNWNTRTRCKICAKLTIKTPDRRHWCRFGVFLLLTLNVFQTLP